MEPVNARPGAETPRALQGREEGRSSSTGLVSRDLRAIVLKALRVEPERRYATVGELIDDLLRMREGHPVRARPGTRSYRAARFVARHKLGVVAATVSVAAFLVAGASVIWSLHDRQQRTAEMLRLARMAGLLITISEMASPAPMRRHIFRNGRSVTPAIGARTTGLLSL